MGIRKYRGQIVCDKRWPDGTRIIRKCANRTLAKELLTRIEASIVDGSWQRFREQLKLRDRVSLALREFSETYINEYAKARNKTRSWKRKETSLRALKKHLGPLELEMITPAHLHRYVQKRKRTGVSDATINRDLTVIKHLLTYAAECGLIRQNNVERFKNLREERKERQRFTQEQVEAVISAVRKDCRALFVFILETGCRREEGLSLKHWQIQRDSKLVVFSEDTKSRNFRYVPLTEKALEAVDTLPRLEKCPYVFYNPLTFDRWKQCRKPWERARESVGLEDLQVKDLRRHFAIRLAERGANMHDIQQVLGHASVTTTERHYAQFSPGHSAKKILRVLEGGKSEMETKRKQALSHVQRMG